MASHPLGFPGLHKDFKWLLNNKSDQVLSILCQHWAHYEEAMTNTAKDTLADHEFMCESGVRAALRKTYIPLPTLVAEGQRLGNTNHCNFLDLPSGDPMDSKFLSTLGAGMKDGLDFYLWLLDQIRFVKHIDVEKSKELYLGIQSQATLPRHAEKVK
jgi:hypothetical protein